MNNIIDNNQLQISVVIPLFNEDGSIKELYNKLITQLKEMAGESYEIIFVDDGSNDDSFNILEEIHSNDSHVKVIRFRTNFGKSAGLALGFEKAKGKYVFTMDADLQDDPNELPAMLELLKENMIWFLDGKKLGMILGTKHFHQHCLTKLSKKLRD